MVHFIDKETTIFVLLLLSCLQSIEAVKDVVFPTRALRRELEIAKEKMEDMQAQLKYLEERESQEKRAKVNHCL